VPDIIAAHTTSQRELSIQFDNGYQGTLKLDDFIDSYTGVFKPLLDPEYFDCLSINTDLGTVCWPNGADLCPDSVYKHMIKTTANVPTQ
jgi:Protein of unknown function (DUF2442)